MKDKIGHGSYGVVFKVVRKVDRMTYAMKEIDLQGMSRKEQEECIRETRVLSSLDSDFIIKYYDSFLERGKLYIITEYASNGNLHDYIKKQKQKLPEELIWKLFVQILLGLNHMHSKKILHRDIKTLNVFLDDDLNVKLGDMGVAKILSTHTNFAKTIVGTPYYLSPELCEDKPYNEKSDVWALGVVLYECCVQRHPFDADNQGALILKILRGKYPPVVGYSPEVSDVIKRCLTQNANRRPNTYKLLLLPGVRQKSQELGIILPDTETLIALAEKSNTTKLTRSTSANKAPSSQPPTAPGDAGQPPTDKPAQGVIRVMGNMDQPPSAEVNHQAAVASNEDKAFVFGGTLKAQPPAQAAQAVDISVDNIPVGDGGNNQAAWLVGLGARPAVVAAASVQDVPANAGAAARNGWGEVPDMSGLQLDDEEGDEEENVHNPYDNPYREPDDEHDGEEEEGEEGEGEEDYDGAGDGEEEADEEYEDDYEEDDKDPAGSSGGWQPDPGRLQGLRSAMMLQRAACLDLIGDKAFNELYALLKSNQVDEASMTDLSRLVFKIIPYDKSEVIQMMYKLLYLESQLETDGNSAA